MDATWVIGACLLVVGVVAAARPVGRRSRTACWTHLCSSLVAHSVRDLLRDRERFRRGVTTVEKEAAGDDPTATDQQANLEGQRPHVESQHVADGEQAITDGEQAITDGEQAVAGDD